MRLSVVYVAMHWLGKGRQADRVQCVQHTVHGVVVSVTIGGNGTIGVMYLYSLLLLQLPLLGSLLSLQDGFRPHEKRQKARHQAYPDVFRFFRPKGFSVEEDRVPDHPTPDDRDDSHYNAPKDVQTRLRSGDGPGQGKGQGSAIIGPPQEPAGRLPARVPGQGGIVSSGCRKGVVPVIEKPLQRFGCCDRFRL
jgi:hypothetical protein